MIGPVLLLATDWMTEALWEMALALQPQGGDHLHCTIYLSSPFRHGLVKGKAVPIQIYGFDKVICEHEVCSRCAKRQHVFRQ